MSLEDVCNESRDRFRKIMDLLSEEKISLFELKTYLEILYKRFPSPFVSFVNSCVPEVHEGYPELIKRRNMAELALIELIPVGVSLEKFLKPYEERVKND